LLLLCVWLRTASFSKNRPFIPNFAQKEETDHLFLSPFKQLYLIENEKVTKMTRLYSTFWEANSAFIVPYSKAGSRLLFYVSVFL
jgi:hypothetical protein